MNILIIGCGKVGSKLACVLDQIGHDVCIVDRDPESFDRLDHDFSGYTVSGVPIDQDVLRRAGIEGSDAVLAVTPDDNVNLMAAQLAREVFHIGTVLTRIYDPQRENVFSHYDLHTFCPTNLTVEAVCSALEGVTGTHQLSIGHSTISYTLRPVSEDLIGRPMRDAVPGDPDAVLFGVQRKSGDVVLTCDQKLLLEKGDSLIFAKVVD